jgi:hypothetical protein
MRMNCHHKCHGALQQDRQQLKAQAEDHLRSSPVLCITEEVLEKIILRHQRVDGKRGAQRCGGALSFVCTYQHRCSSSIKRSMPVTT